MIREEKYLAVELIFFRVTNPCFWKLAFYPPKLRGRTNNKIAYVGRVVWEFIHISTGTNLRRFGSKPSDRRVFQKRRDLRNVCPSARFVWLLLSTRIHTALFLVHPPARISENRNTRIATFFFGRANRCVAAAILSRISFLSRVFPLFFKPTGPGFPRVIPSRKERMARGGREDRKKERERRAVFARAGAEETRMARERGRPTIPRCLPFIKLLLNAAFHRTHNWIGKTAKIMPLPARYTPAGPGGCNERGKESGWGRARERERRTYRKH